MGGIICSKKDVKTEDLILSQKTGKGVVEQKLLHSVYRDKFAGHKDTMDRLAEALSSVAELKATYLTTDWVETENFHRNQDEHMSKRLSAIKISSPSPAGDKAEQANPTNFGSSSTASEMEDVTKKESKPEDDDGIEEAEIKETDPSLLKLAKDVKIKIVVSEVAETQGKKNFRRFVSPILSKFDLLPQLGMFHSALVVGPWMIEWNNSALCIPRKCVSKAALITADVDAALATKNDVDNVVDNLAKVIVKWNTKILYNDTDKAGGRYGNCQDFVNDVLQSIGVDPKFDGPLGRYLEKLRTTGNEKLVFEPDDAFAKKFSLTEKKIEFHSHEELDRFVLKLMEVDCEFSTRHKREYMFIKSFDRAFWLRHFKFDKDPLWKPVFLEEENPDPSAGGRKELVESCPFKNPLVTFSIRL